MAEYEILSLPQLQHHRKYASRQSHTKVKTTSYVRILGLMRWSIGLIIKML